jgi:hypothetical protein
MQAIDAFVVAADKDVEAIWLAAQMPLTITLPHKGGGDLKAPRTGTLLPLLDRPANGEKTSTKDPNE